MLTPRRRRGRRAGPRPRDPSRRPVTADVTARFVLTEGRPPGPTRSRGSASGRRRRAKPERNTGQIGCGHVHARCSWPTGVRSRFGPSAPRTSWAQTVAVYPYEDRNAVHRIKADEAYRIGERGHPVRAYLDIDEIIRAARSPAPTRSTPVTASCRRTPDLARACDAGITFIGPPADVLELAGNKVRALAAARAAGVPTLRSTPPSADVDELVAGRAGDRVPGLRQGRRRRWRSRHAAGRRPGAAARVHRGRRCARPRARSATRPRSSSRPWAPAAHRGPVADGSGHVMHLFERDLSIRGATRGHRDRPGAATGARRAARGAVRDAVRFATSIGYWVAGTARSSSRPRARAPATTCSSRWTRGSRSSTRSPRRSPTSTCVQSQMRIASGESPRRPRAVAGAVRIDRAVVQCRHHRGPGERLPPRHRHHHCVRQRRWRGGPPRRRHGRHGRGDQLLLRLDAGRSSSCRARTFDAAVARQRRALAG